MAVIIRKAERKKAKLRLAISAPSGAGKTMGSLLLAFGMMRRAYPNLTEQEIWDKIGFMDTEEGSGELFVGVEKHGVLIREFPYSRISNNYDPVKYIETIHAFEKSGVEVIIGDSLTHAWAGAGGILEKHGKATDADKNKNSYTAWRSVTPQHDALVGAILHSPCHFIGTLRSKVEYAMQTGISGKQQVVKLGMAPIQREGMEYEFTVFFDIDSNSVARATKDRTDMFSMVNAARVVEKKEFTITPQIGMDLMDWLNRGAEPPRPIGELADEMAGAVLQSLDVQATVDKFAETYKRLEAENPFLFSEMNQLLDSRHAELNQNNPAS